MLRIRLILGLLCLISFAVEAHSEEWQMSVLLTPFQTVRADLKVPEKIDCTSRFSSNLNIETCQTPDAKFILENDENDVIIDIDKIATITSVYDYLNSNTYKEIYYSGSYIKDGSKIWVNLEIFVANDIISRASITLNKYQSYTIVGMTKINPAPPSDTEDQFTN